MKLKSVNSIDHSICTGCMMCSDICVKGAISFKYDTGFWFPCVDKSKCVECGLCSLRCPALNEVPIVTGPVSCYGAKSKDDDVRWNSTSGGFFFELATAVIKEGGACIGAEYGLDNEILHSIETEQEGIKKLRQSKYAQSRTEGIYTKTQRLLDSGVYVLFCGTPCQVEALNAYLKKNYENLLTMDFFCLGICSPLVYRRYLDLMELRYKSKVTKVWFKNKQKGWRKIGTRLEFASGESYFRTGNRDLFMVAFVGDSIAMRKNCETCKFRKIPHNSDITVADFWGIEKVNLEMDDDKGVSAIIINTPRGAIWFDKISRSLDVFETTEDSIVKGNFSAIEPKKAGKNRDAFLNAISNEMPLDMAMEKYGEMYNGINKIKVDCHYYRNSFISKIKKIIKSI